MATNEKVISASIKALGMCVSTALMGFILWKVTRYLDPNYESKKAAKQKVEELKTYLNIDSRVELNSHEMRLATQIVLPEEGAELDEIGGCSQILENIEDNVMMPLQLRAKNIPLPSIYYTAPKGILLHGPPGCGKTLIARAIAKRTNAYFINFDISILNDMWYGETSKFTKALFTLSKKIQPCIIFIDEIDSVLRNRSHHDHETTALMKTQFMALWDGFASTDNAVIIIGATNRPEDVDDAILRRLPYKVHVPKPDVTARQEILRVLLRNENRINEFDYWKIANATESMSGSDLKEIVRAACLDKYNEAVRALIHTPDGSREQLLDVRISHEDIISAAKKFMENAKDLKKKSILDSIILD